MADNGTTLSSPPFREALSPLQAPLKRPLLMHDTWQRWLDRWWQQHTALWHQGQGGTWQPLDATLTALANLTTSANTMPYFSGVDQAAVTALSPYSRTLLDDLDAASWRYTLGTVGGTGAAQNVALWQDATALTYDTLLHWDTANDRLGIGTSTPTAPLTFPASVGQKMHLYASGNERYGLAIASAQLQVFAGNDARVSLGNMSSADGTTFTSRFDVETTRVTARVPFTANSNTGLPYDPPVNVWVRTGSMSSDSLRLGGGDTVARWPLDCVGMGFVNYIGCGGSGPVEGWGIYSGANWMRLGAVVGVNVQPGGGYNLEVSGALRADTTTLGRTGIAYAPDASYWLRAGNAYIDAVTTPTAAITQLTVSGTTNLQGSYTGITGGADSRWNCTLWGTVYFAGQVHMANYVGILGVSDNRFAARFYAAIYCDGVPYTGGGGPWAAYSDRRLKHNIHPIVRPLETMTRLHGVCYEYRDTADGKPAGVRMGVLAQEVEAVVPQWVGELDGYKTTQLSAFEALAIESFKELTARVTALEESCRGNEHA